MAKTAAAKTIFFVENIRVTEYNKRWSIGYFMEDNNS